MTTTPSADAQKFFEEEDDEEVLPAGAASVPASPKAVNPAKALPARRRGRPVFQIQTEKGSGLYRCGNCQFFSTPWRRSPDKKGPKKSCADFGVVQDSKPCSFSMMDPIRRFAPISFGEVGIGSDLTLPDIYLTRILLNRREDEILAQEAMPFRKEDKVQFIYENKYHVGFVETFNRQYVYVRLENSDKIVPMMIGSVTKA